MSEFKKDFIATAKERFDQAVEDEREIRLEAEKDLRFAAGDQWDELIKQDRVAAKRPVLTFNRLPTYIQQVANEARQNKAEIKFAPTDDEATADTVEVIEGLARHIQYTSDASIAYETALEYAVACSIGYYRFLTGYCDNESFDQELKVVPVYDPFSVYGVMIPSIFGRAVPWAFVIEDMPKEEYKRTYGDTELVKSGFDLDGMGDWASDDTVRIAEYWYVEETKENLILLQNQAGNLLSWPENDLKNLPADFRKGRTIIDERQTTKQKVKFCKMNGMEVLPGSETDWLGSTIPIIPCLGKQLILKGKPKLFSLIRFQREPQQLINYAKTRIAEILATAPVSPFIGPIGFMQGREAQWKMLNTVITPAIEYNDKSASGEKIDKPERQVFEPPIKALSEFTAQEVDDLKAISGIFDQSLGEGTNDQSGLAIQRRQRQSNSTNLHFTDNLERAQKKGGPVIAELIKPIYGKTARMIRILGADETPKIVKVNQDYQKGGKTVNHDLSKGKYDLIITVGPSFSTKRMESFDMMTSILQGQPQLMLMIGDIFFKNSDTAGADQMAERFKRIISMTHPGLIDDKENDPASQAQALQGQLAQAHQVIQAGAQHIQQMEKERDAKVIENQAKVQIAQAQELSKQEIVKLQEATKLAVAQINASKDANQSYAELELKRYNIMHDASHDLGLQKDQQAHEKEMAQQAAQNQAGLADQGHQQTLEQGDAAAANQSALAQQTADNQPEDNGA